MDGHPGDRGFLLVLCTFANPFEQRHSQKFFKVVAACLAIWCFRCVAVAFLLTRSRCPLLLADVIGSGITHYRPQLLGSAIWRGYLVVPRGLQCRLVFNLVWVRVDWSCSSPRWSLRSVVCQVIRLAVQGMRRTRCCLVLVPASQRIHCSPSRTSSCSG